MGQEYIIMLAILLCSIVGHNMSVAYAAGAVIILKLMGLNQLIDILGDKGIRWGIILLTAAILVPIATGKITLENIWHCFQSPAGIISLIVGAGCDSGRCDRDDLGTGLYYGLYPFEKMWRRCGTGEWTAGGSW